MAKASSKIVLKSCKMDLNGVDLVNGLPERLKIFEWGRNETLKGPVVIDKDSLAVFDENQRKLGRETCPIDFQHGTVEGSEAWKAAKGNPDIAGYFRPRIVENEGLYLENVSTTPTGLKKAADFKDLSPTPLVDEKTGRLIGLHSLALTPTGAVPGLTIESAALKAMSATFKTLSVSLMDKSAKAKSEPAAYSQGQPDYYNDLDDEIMKEEQLAALRTAMGVSEEMSWDELFPTVLAKIGKGKEGPITHKENTRVATWPGGFEYKTMMAEFDKALEAKVTPLTAKVEELQSELANKRADLEKQQKDNILATAGKEGKVITLSSDVISGLSVSALTDVVKGWPINPPPTKVTMRVLDAKPATKPTRSDAARLIQMQVNSQLSTATN